LLIENGVLQSRLMFMKNENNEHTIDLMDKDDSKYAYLLPDIISKFRPQIQLGPLRKEEACEDVEGFLVEIDSIVESDLKQLFSLVTTLQTIQEIQTEANKSEMKLNFANFIEEFQLKQSVDFYGKNYLPLINTRVQEIVKDNWSRAIDKAFNSIKDLIEDVDQIEELDMWSDRITDLPLSLAEALSEDLKMKKLLMKSKGYGVDINNICTVFDNDLKDIIEEINVLLVESNTTTAADRSSLINFLSENAKLQMTHFLSQVKSLELSSNQRKELLFLIRVSTALIELCPCLRTCFEKSSNNENWVRFCKLYEEELCRFWQKLADGILEEHHCSKNLRDKMNHDVILADFAVSVWFRFAKLLV